MADDPYNETVRRRFARPGHAGDIGSPAGLLVVAEVAESAAGARIRLAADVADERVQALRFRVTGCPHLIALLDEVCEAATGVAVRDLAGLVTPALGERLALPRSKTGKALLVEDALRKIMSRYEAMQAKERNGDLADRARG